MLPDSKQKMLHLNFRDLGLLRAISQEPWNQRKINMNLQNALAKLQ